MDVFLNSDEDLLKKCNTIWDKINTVMKGEFQPAANKSF